MVLETERGERLSTNLGTNGHGSKQVNLVPSNTIWNEMVHVPYRYKINQSL